MPLIRTTKVKLGKNERPEIDTSYVTDDEWHTFTQVQMKLKAQRSHAGTVFTLVTKDMVTVTEIVIK
jgi:hypothetical protein